MHLSSSVAKATVIALVLLMASVALISVPTKAAPLPLQNSGGIPLPAGVTPDFRVKTIPYLSFRPNPVGVGQSILVNVWITPATHYTHYVAGYKVTITKPDGTQDVKVVDSYFGDATAWFEYVADQVGTWKLKFDVPGAYYPAGNYCRPGQETPPGYTSVAAGSTADRYWTFPGSCYYEPSSTKEQDLIVQEQQVFSWPPAALPTDYWTRPVQSELREWVPILGDYPWYGPGGGPDWPADTNTYWSSRYRFVPYVQAPNTAHIAWKRQGAISGLIGATLGLDSFAAGGGNPSMIFQGMCYQSITKMVDGKPTNVWQCYDLRTGQVYWEQTNVTQVPTAIEYYRGTGETPGASAGAFNRAIYPIYIGGGRLIKYDPWTGAASVNVSISPFTTGTYYMNGYALTVQDLGATAGTNRYRLINWTTLGPTTTFTDRIVGNITWPFSSVPASIDFNVGIAVSQTAITPDEVGAWYGVRLEAASLKTGQLLWNITDSFPVSQFSGSCTVADHGKVAVRTVNGFWVCWDLASGKKLWTSESADYPWGIWSAYSVSSAYGLIFDTTYAGLYAFDWNDGKIAWVYKHTSVPYETPYEGDYSFRGSPIIADGKLYTQNTEHTPSQPITRGWKLHCVNALTGEGIWNITGEASPGAVADGYITASNTYDGYMYVFGKGKSETTVTAPDVVMPKGNGIVIRGKVMDMSPGQPNTPCVSKDSMATQMEYLHMQLPIDGIWHNATITGVPVLLSAIASDGSYVDLGTVTTDGYYGTFSKTWTPPNEGDYQIIASFAGDDSYGSSAASITISVGPAAASTNTGQQEIIIPDYTMTILGVGIAVILAVAIVGILTLKKK